MTKTDNVRLLIFGIAVLGRIGGSASETGGPFVH